MYDAVLFINVNKLEEQFKGSIFNSIVADIIVVFCAIVLIIHVIAILSIPCIIKRQMNQNQQRSNLSHISGSVSSFCSLLGYYIKNFIYPEVVDTDILE